MREGAMGSACQPQHESPLLARSRASGRACEPRLVWPCFFSQQLGVSAKGGWMSGNDLVLSQAYGAAGRPFSPHAEHEGSSLTASTYEGGTSLWLDDAKSSSAQIQGILPPKLISEAEFSSI